jgi:hypothetical protein
MKALQAMLHCLLPSFAVAALGAPATPAAPPNVPLVMVGLANGGNPGESPPQTSFDDPAKVHG